MSAAIAEFLDALRAADLTISPADSIDAYSVVDMVGFENRSVLKNALLSVCATSEKETRIFSLTFDRFFSFDRFQQPNEGGAQGPQAFEPQSALAEMLTKQDRAALAIAMADASKAASLSNIFIFTQKGLYTRRIMEHMGLADLNREIAALQKIETAEADDFAESLKGGREFLREEVRNYVEQQLAVHAGNRGAQLREDILSEIKLTNVERRDFHIMHEIVQKMAKRLATMQSRRRHKAKRGQLDVRRTIRKNMGYDGVLFETLWKEIKIDRPDVIAVCDVSGSVSTVARFLLMFLYSLNEVLPKVRSFAFSGFLGEVTELFETLDIEDAIAETLDKYADRSTDYGMSLMDLEDLVVNDIDHRTTVIILGDGRSNYTDPRADILKKIFDRSMRVIWLNPEPRTFWDVGDSEMRKYLPYCHQARVCNTLKDLERVASDLVRSIV